MGRPVFLRLEASHYAFFCNDPCCGPDSAHPETAMCGVLFARMSVPTDGGLKTDDSDPGLNSQQTQHSQQAGAPLAMLSVRDYGAVGNGAADDGPAIQRGIDASQQQQRALWFPAGVYAVSQGLVVRCTKPFHGRPAANTSKLVGEGQHQVAT